MAVGHALYLKASVGRPSRRLRAKTVNVQTRFDAGKRYGAVTCLYSAIGERVCCTIR